MWLLQPITIKNTKILENKRNISLFSSNHRMAETVKCSYPDHR